MRVRRAKLHCNPKLLEANLKVIRGVELERRTILEELRKSTERFTQIVSVDSKKIMLQKCISVVESLLQGDTTTSNLDNIPSEALVSQTF